MFVSLRGMDGRLRAVKPSDIRLLEDTAEAGVATVTLVDGTQFDALSDVQGILNLIEATEPSR